MKKTFRDFTISSFDPSEGSAFFQLMENNRTRLNDYFPGTVSYTQTLEDTLNYCEEIAEKVIQKTYFPFTIKSQSDDSFVGWVDVKSMDWRIPKGELGYFIDQNYEGQGLISEAVGHVVEHLVATYQFKKLLIRANAENIGSGKVALKNGFLLEGTIKNDHKTMDGKVVDLDYYGRIF